MQLFKVAKMSETKKISKKFLSAQKSAISDKSLLLNLTGEMPLFKVIDFLLDNKGMDFSKKDIAKGAEISRASLFNYWSELERHGIVKVTRSFGKTKLYTLNSKNPVTQKIIELEKTLITEALDNAPKSRELLVEH